MLSCKHASTDISSVKLIKVLAWNIWHAGHSKAYPKIGCEETIRILKHSEADIILIVETYGAASTIADSLEFYHRLLSNNLSIYSRYPIVETYTFPDSISTFNFGGVKINIDGAPIRIYNTWLHYLPDLRLTPTEKSEKEILAWDNEGTRDDEIRVILSALSPSLNEANSIPVIMGGDFNSHSHLDWTAETRNLYNHGDAVVNWTVSKMIEEAGFKDSFREIHPDPVENIGATWIYEIQENEKEEELPSRLDRIDYIYYKGEKLHVKDAETYNTKLGEQLTFKGKDFLFASDHGFVMTTFEIREK